MAISLKNIEDRVKALEESGVSGWTKGSNSNGYWAKETTTGLIIQWGVVAHPTSTSPTVDMGTTLTLPLPYKDTNYSIQIAQNSWSNGEPGSWAPRYRNVTSTSFYFYVNSTPMRWFTIGYLITDRLLNILYKAFARNIYTQLWQKLVSKFFTS